MILREQFRISFGDIKIAILELNEVSHGFTDRSGGPRESGENGLTHP